MEVVPTITITTLIPAPTAPTDIALASGEGKGIAAEVHETFEFVRKCCVPTLEAEEAALTKIIGRVEAINAVAKPQQQPQTCVELAAKFDDIENEVSKRWDEPVKALRGENTRAWRSWALAVRRDIIETVTPLTSDEYPTYVSKANHHQYSAFVLEALANCVAAYGNVAPEVELPGSEMEGEGETVTDKATKLVRQQAIQHEYAVGELRKNLARTIPNRAVTTRGNWGLSSALANCVITAIEEAMEEYDAKCGKPKDIVTYFAKLYEQQTVEEEMWNAAQAFLTGLVKVSRKPFVMATHLRAMTLAWTLFGQDLPSVVPAEQEAEFAAAAMDLAPHALNTYRELAIGFSKFDCPGRKPYRVWLEDIDICSKPDSE